jgi:sarcosine oxidase, subunit gamma
VTASPERSSPLGHWTERFAAASTAGERFTIRETPFLAQISLRGNLANQDFQASAATALGFGLPMATNTWSGNGVRQALWLGPDECLIVSAEPPEAIEDTLGRGVHDLRHAVVDLSANRTTIEISGGEARLVLAKGASFDVHAHAFAPPAVVQSLIAKAQVILQCLDARPVFRIFVRPSFADYLAAWLLDAAAECAASRALDAERLAVRLGS